MRDTNIARRKSTQEFIRTFKEIKIRNSHNLNLILKEISIILRKDSENDRSDRKQLAIAVENRMDYFITRDSALLDNAEEIYRRFQIEIVKPTEFIINLDSLINSNKYQPARLAGANFDMCRIRANEIEIVIDEFLQKSKEEKKSEFRDRVNKVLSDTSLSCGYIVKSHSDSNHAIFGYAIREGRLIAEFIRVKKSPLSTTLFIQLVNNLIQRALEHNSLELVVNEPFLGLTEQNVLHEFRFAKNGNTWVKFNLTGTCAIAELDSLIRKFENYDHIKEVLPSISLEPDTQKILELERKFFPLKISNIDLPTFIVPIKPIWASQLFDHVSASELIFGSNPSIAWSRENVYYRSAHPEIVYSPARILWYLSDDRKSTRRQSIVACSYLDDVDIDEAKKIFNKYKRFGVYNWSEIYDLAGEDIKKKIMAIRFSDTELFPFPIKYKVLKIFLFYKLKRNYTFQSPVKISEDIFLNLYCMGFKMPIL